MYTTSYYTNYFGFSQSAAGFNQLYKSLRLCYYFTGKSIREMMRTAVAAAGFVSERGIKMNVYDFDNTIYDGESFLDLFFFFFKKDPALVKYVPAVMSGLYKYTKGTINAEEALAEYSHIIVEYYNSLEDFDAEINEFWDLNMHKIKMFYFRQRRDDDIIISASPDMMLGEIMNRLNIKNYICSETDGKASITDLCFRGRKVEMFREKYPDAVIDNFYTDSVNDTPLMEIAEHAFLVSGNKIKQVK